MGSGRNNFVQHTLYEVIRAYGQWNKAEQSYKIGAYRKANEGFAKAYPTLVHNGLFLQQYGKSLEMEERYPQAIALLKQATKYYNDEFTAITLGNRITSYNVCYTKLLRPGIIPDSYQHVLHKSLRCNLQVPTRQLSTLLFLLYLT